MTTFIEKAADYLGETVTVELPTVDDWFFKNFPPESGRPRGYVGRHRWNVRRRSPLGGAR